MAKKKSLYTLEEWDRLATLRLVEEPTYSPDSPCTGIECPNVSGPLRSACRAHLYDIPFHPRQFIWFVIKLSPFISKEKIEFYETQWRDRRFVVCRLCGWSGTRKKGCVPESDE